MKDYYELIKQLRCYAKSEEDALKHFIPKLAMAEAADAIEELEKSINTIEQNYNVLLKTNEKQGKDINFLTTILPKWIPVTERLPEENKPVVATYWHENKRYSLIMFLDEFTWFRPTHWFYLPEPPKEETDG